MTAEDSALVMRGFYNIAKFPGVLGAIDCTHVSIQSPGGHLAEQYRNRKGYFSINVQATCDASLRITNIVARWPGSVHDATIFSNSRLCAMFETKEVPKGFLLGDGAYPNKSYLLTPLSTVTTQGERRYNFSQIRTRNPIERTFGVWKRRFPCLKLGLRVQLQRSLVVIVACAVLHNIALRLHEEDAPPDENVTAGSRVYEEVPDQNQIRTTTGLSTIARTRLINNHFSR